MKYLLSALILIGVTGCIPNTKYSTTDDYATGLRWFERGMQNNDINAINNAIRYWQPLVDKGDCDAEYRMGLMHFTAIGMQQSFETAHKLWVKAANGDQQRAQWALGDLYFQSEADVFHHCTKTPTCTIKKDLEEALFWYKLFEKSAKYSGEEKYVNHILPKVTAQLTPERIKAVDTKVAAWSPTPKDCGARNMW